MENFNEIPTVNFDAVLEEEAKNKPNTYVNNKKVFNEKNYLNTMLKEGEKEKTLIIRILPNPNEENYNPFVHVHVHKLSNLPEAISKSGYKSYFCLSKYQDHTDKIDHEKFGCKCPFCELQRDAFELSKKETDPVKKEELKKLSLKNIAVESVIMRVIDRNDEKQGPKFWKVNVSRRGDDAYSLILKLYNNLKKIGEATHSPENIFDSTNGRDLIVTISRSDNPLDKKTTISITQAPNKSPISTDVEEMRKWIFDEKKWDDVFTVKPYDYLSVISEGGIPFYDKNEGKWVRKDDFDSKKETEKKELEAETQKAAEKINEEIRTSEKALGDMFVKDEDLPL